MCVCVCERERERKRDRERELIIEGAILLVTNAPFDCSFTNSSF